MAEKNKTNVKKTTATNKTVTAKKPTEQKKTTAVKKPATAKTTVTKKTTATTKKSAAPKKAAVKKITPAIKVDKKKEVIFIASEGQPFVATGGLADVIGSLPQAIASNGNYKASVILPLYSQVDANYRQLFKFVGNFEVSLSWRRVYCGVFTFEYKGVTYYFIDNEYYFKRDNGLYGYYDDGERFAFFSKAALDVIGFLGIYPDVIHCHDWQTALSVVYLKTAYKDSGMYNKIKTVYTIHNIEYQGKYGFDVLGDLFGLSDEYRGVLDNDGCINLMKAAIELSDKVTTVSPTYANEIKDDYYAHGLASTIRRNEFKITGILNGIDTDFYNPETDRMIFENYSVADVSGKAVCKKSLQTMLNLPVREDVPIIAMISRLVGHKGLDLVKQVANEILLGDVQLVILGKGDSVYENFFTDLQRYYPGKCATMIAYNQDLSRKIYSGADIFLMPSKTEPCGLSQMIASRYGTVAIVRETGGLNDTIKAGAGGNGYTFNAYNAYDMLYVIREAVRDFADKNKWKEVQERAMTTDFSWKNQAQKYEELY